MRPPGKAEAEPGKLVAASHLSHQQGGAPGRHLSPLPTLSLCMTDVQGPSKTLRASEAAPPGSSAPALSCGHSIPTCTLGPKGQGCCCPDPSKRDPWDRGIGPTRENARNALSGPSPDLLSQERGWVSGQQHPLLRMGRRESKSQGGKAPARTPAGRLHAAWPWATHFPSEPPRGTTSASGCKQPGPGGPHSCTRRPPLPVRRRPYRGGSRRPR